MTKRYFARGVLAWGLFAFLAFGAVAARADGPTPAPGTGTDVTLAAPAGCGENLADLLPATTAEVTTCSSAPAVGLGIPEPEFLAKPGYCRCGCGARCRTSADCGGAECTAFISCC